jgi:predicted small lipoprotein YifL
MKSSLRALTCFVVLALALSACGNKGDLVLPERPAPEAQDAAAAR